MWNPQHLFPHHASGGISILVLLFVHVYFYVRLLPIKTSPSCRKLDSYLPFMWVSSANTAYHRLTTCKKSVRAKQTFGPADNETCPGHWTMWYVLCGMNTWHITHYFRHTLSEHIIAWSTSRPTWPWEARGLLKISDSHVVVCFNICILWMSWRNFCRTMPMELRCRHFGG